MIKFDVDGYKELINTFIMQGYNFKFFLDDFADKNIVYLRHDVDFNISYAYEMAHLDFQMNVRSTFFFLINSEMYNLLEPSNIQLIREVSELGHQIALHVDERHVTSHADFLKQMMIFCQMFPFANRKIISRHRPNLLRIPEWITPDYEDVYQEKFFNRIEYASDSRGEWKYGLPIEREAFKKKQSFQLLIHPIWWINEEETSAEKIAHFLYDCEIKNKKAINYFKLF